MIPDDVMRAAKAAAYATETVGESESAITSANGVRVIASAIMAERERCVRVCEVEAQDFPPAKRDALKWAAFAIRKSEK